MPKPLTILFDAQRLYGSKTGVEYYTSSLIQSLADAYPHDLQLIGYHSAAKQGTVTLPSAPNIQYRRVFVAAKVINSLRRIGLSLPVEVIARCRADFLLFPNFLGLPSLFDTARAPVIHDLTFVDLLEYVAPRNLKDLQRFVPKELQKSNFVVTVSEFSKQRISDEFAVPPEKILVTPIPPQRPIDQSDDEAQKVLGDLGVSGKYILTLGTVEPRKNLLAVLDAYLLLPEEIQSIYTFVIAGKVGWNCDKEMSRIKELVEAGKNIKHLGYVDDQQRAALYRNAALFTSASNYEGFGMPVLEAMSYGTPCAISDIPVFREVAHDAALYFDQQDPAAIASAWSKLLSDTSLQNQLAEAGRKQVSSYSWAVVAESLYDKIKAVLQENPHG